MDKLPPWETHSHIWPTKSKYMSFIRGGIRKGLWNRNPVKIQFKRNNRQRVPLGKKTTKNPEGLIWGGVCYYCNKGFKQNKLQVDHINGGNSLKSMEDLQNFIESMIFVEDHDLRFACKKCHDQKTLSERMQISFEDAGIEKEAIKFYDKTAFLQKQILSELGLDVASNAKARRAVYTAYLKKRAVIDDNS